ncbi:hypothetical protein, partial [Guyparkeria sp.]|uniref:hypothetical protein n=1 Tax=Guyparkeria sp. TaxID=2035736 RepID=UPI0039710268
MLQLSPSRHANVIAVLVILLLAAGFGAIMLGKSKISAVGGPMTIAADPEGHFHFHAGDSLYAVTAEGEVTHRADLASLGLGDRITDMQVSGAFLLVGDADTGAIAWCARDLSGCSRRTPLPEISRSNVFHFHHDATSDRLFLVSGDRIHVIGTDGRHVRQLSVPDGLDHPNTIRAGRDG